MKISLYIKKLIVLFLSYIFFNLLSVTGLAFSYSITKQPINETIIALIIAIGLFHITYILFLKDVLKEKKER